MNSKNTLFTLLSFFTFAQTVDAMLAKVTKQLPFRSMQRTKKPISCNQYKNAMPLSMHSFSTQSDAIIKSTNKGHLPYIGMLLLTTGVLLYLDYLVSDHYGDGQPSLCVASRDNDIWTAKILINLGKM